MAPQHALAAESPRRWRSRWQKEEAAWVIRYVEQSAKRKAEPSAKAEGKRRAVLKKKAGKETATHAKLAKKRSSKKKKKYHHS